MHSNTAVTVRGAEMKKSNFVMFLISVGASLGSGENDSSERNNPIISTNTPEVSSNPITTERLPNILPTHHPTPHQTQLRLHRQQHYHFPRPSPNIPHFGFSTTPNQRIHPSDHTANYHLSLHNFRQQRPTDFHAYILNPDSDQQYVPYNYPPYSGTPLATEPPAATAYQRPPSKSNYYIPPTAEVDDYSPNGYRNLPQNFFYSDSLAL